MARGVRGKLDGLEREVESMIRMLADLKEGVETVKKRNEVLIKKNEELTEKVNKMEVDLSNMKERVKECEYDSDEEEKNGRKQYQKYNKEE